MKNDEKTRYSKLTTKKKANNRSSPTRIQQSGDGKRIGDIPQDSKSTLGISVSPFRNLPREKKHARANSSCDSYFSPKLIKRGIYGSRVLTEKEIKIIELVNKGLSNDEIGLIRGYSGEYIKYKTFGIFTKLGLYSKLQLALWWERNGSEILNEKKNLHNK